MTRLLPFLRHSNQVFLVPILMLLGLQQVFAQTTNETMRAGSFIINMGSNKQTNANSLRPYGLIYDLTRNNQVPVKWVINPSKAKDGADFVYKGVTYRGGTFIIPAEFRNTAVNDKINSYLNSGMVGVTTTEAITVPVYATINTAVRWTLDDENGDIALPFFGRANIPSSAYNRVKPQNLGACNDIFVMPHADPTQSTHGNLNTWNLNHKGSIWVGCKAGSELENRVARFLSTSGLVPTKHDNLKGRAAYDFPAEPVMQFIGTGIQNVTNEGAEQIYIPSPTWRPTTKVGVYQENIPTPNARRALIAWGRGFGDPNRGWVNMTAGHNIAKQDNENSVAAIRAFFNFSLLTAIDRSVVPSLTGLPSAITVGTANPLSYTLTPNSGGPYTTQWTSSCGGTFSPNATSANVTFTPPAGITSCVITVRITDACGRIFFDAKRVDVQCALNVTRTITNVSCQGGTNGAINMAITGSAGPYNWSWTRVGGGTGSGTGTAITGLSVGTYNVTVTSAAGCVSTFTALVNQPNALVATATANNYNCFGQTGSIALVISGGTPTYSVAWTGPNGFTATTRNLSNVVAGTYQATVTDLNGCTTTASATVTGPATALLATVGGKTNVTCAGLTNGSLSVTASGGTPGYTYAWSDNPAITSASRTGLGVGSYTVTVTDAKGCKATMTETIDSPEPLLISVTKVDPTCPPGADPSVGKNGSIDITVTGGVAPYTYAWTTLDGDGLVPTAADQVSLTAGLYTVVVTDTNGCTRTLSVTLTNVLPFPATPIKINN